MARGSWRTGTGCGVSASFSSPENMTPGHNIFSDIIFYLSGISMLDRWSVRSS